MNQLTVTTAASICEFLVTSEDGSEAIRDLAKQVRCQLSQLGAEPGEPMPQPKGTRRQRLVTTAECCFYACSLFGQELDIYERDNWTWTQSQFENVNNEISVLGTKLMAEAMAISPPELLCRPRLVARG